MPSVTCRAYLLTISRSCGLSDSSSFVLSSFTRGSSEFAAQTAYWFTDRARACLCSEVLVTFGLWQFHIILESYPRSRERCY
jgi:hypothetical protein